MNELTVLNKQGSRFVHISYIFIRKNNNNINNKLNNNIIKKV